MKKSKKIRKEYVILVILLLCIPLAQAVTDENIQTDKFPSSNIIDDEWNKHFGGNYYDGAMDIKQINDKNFIVAGYIHGFTQPLSDGWLLKIDGDGNEIWNKTYGGHNEDIMYSVIETEDGFVIGGYTLSYGNGEADYWLLKTDKMGNELWNGTFGGQEYDFGRKVLQTDDGGYIFLGDASSFNNLHKPDVWVVKTDAYGHELWNKTYGGKETEFADDIIHTEGGYLISGITSSYETHGGWDTWLIKIDAHGNELWNTTYGWRGFELAAYVIEIEGGYMVAGATESITGGFSDAYLIKIDNHGAEIWSKLYGMGDERFNSIKKSDDGYILAGSTCSLSPLSVGDFDVWLVKVDDEGNEVWNRTFGGRKRDYANSLLEIEGTYFIAGETETVGNMGKYDVWIIKCADYAPPQINMVKPTEQYLYVFDKALFPLGRTIILGDITVTAEIFDPAGNINRIEFYLCHIDVEYEYEPRAVIFSPPYEWRWDEPARGLYQLTIGAYYGNAGGVAVDKITVWVFNI